MSILDKFRKQEPVEEIKTPVKRKASSVMLKRFYDAAAINERFLKTPRSESANQTNSAQLKTLRNNSRHAYQNNPLIKSYISLLQTNAVGNGFKLQAKVQNKKRGLHSAVNSVLEAAFDDFCRKGNFEITGRYNLRKVCNLLVGMLGIEGEALIQRLRGQGPHGYQIQLIDIDRLYGVGKSVFEGRTVWNGVEVDEHGKPVAYHILDKHPNDGGGNVQRIPANEIIHIYAEGNRLSYRGVPWTATSLDLLNHFNSYMEAEVTAARMGACLSVFLESDPAAIDDAYEQKDQDQAPAPPPMFDLDPGMIHTLPPGMSVKTLTPNHPNATFAEFNKALQKPLAAGLGISMNALVGDYESTSFSSLRAAWANDKRKYESVQRLLIEDFLDIIYEDWLEVQVLTGNIKGISGDYRFYLPHSFEGPRVVAPDALKDMQTNIMGVESKITSRINIWTELGLDPEEEMQKLALEQELFKRYNIEIPVPKGSPKPIEKEEETETNIKDNQEIIIEEEVDDLEVE